MCGAARIPCATARSRAVRWRHAKNCERSEAEMSTPPVVPRIRSRSSGADFVPSHFNPTDELRGKPRLLGDHSTMKKLTPQHRFDVLAQQLESLTVAQERRGRS